MRVGPEDVQVVNSIQLPELITLGGSDTSLNRSTAAERILDQTQSSWRIPGLGSRPGAGWWFFAIFLGLIVVWALSWSIVGRQLAWPRFHDDAFYYLRVAEQVSNGNGFSIDGLHSTNGFHPFWMTLLVVIFVVVPGGIVPAVVVIHLTLFAIVAGIGVATFRAVSPHVRWPAIVVMLSMLLFSRILTSLLDGMESAILALMVSLTILVIVKTRSFEKRGPTNADWLIGFLLALSFMARLDTAFLVASASGYLAVAALLDREESWSDTITMLVKKQVRILLPVVVVALPFFTWNLVEFGSLVPVSGAIKSSFPEPDFAIETVRAEWVHHAMIFPALAGLFFAFREPSRFGMFRAPLAMGVAMIVVHAAYTELFATWGIFVWYFAAYIPFGMIGAGISVEAIGGRLHRYAPEAIAAGAVAIFVASQAGSLSQLDGTFTEGGDNRSFVIAAEIAGEWAAENTPEDARFAMKDSGSFSFHSRRNVSNLDGVIMNMDYQETLCTGDLHDYLIENGVEYLVMHQTEHAAWGDYGNFALRVRCRLDDGQDSLVEVHEEDEVYRSLRYFDGPRETHLIIWRLQPR